MSRVAIVTGGARGIGAATVAALAADGWRVLAVDRAGDDPRLPYAMATPEELDATAAAANEVARRKRSDTNVDVAAAMAAARRKPSDTDPDAAASDAAVSRKRSDTDPDVATADAAVSRKRSGATVEAAAEATAAEAVRPVVADATDPAAMARVVAAAEEWGELEAVVANAGVIAGGAPAWELPPEQEDAVVETCLRGVMVAARVGIPALLRRPAPRAGRFIAISSAAGSRGLPGLAAYCAAKAGVSGFVRALGLDLRGTGVTAAAVAPGSTDTPILAESARLYGLAGAPDFAAQQPIERLIDPAEIAATIAFLCGPGGAAVTGTTLSVDGGLAI